jgi:hypothetical protein
VLLDGGDLTVHFDGTQSMKAKLSGTGSRVLAFWIREGSEARLRNVRIRKLGKGKP